MAKLILLPIPSIQHSVFVEDIPMTEDQALQYIVPIDPRMGPMTRIQQAAAMIAYTQAHGAQVFAGV